MTKQGKEFGVCLFGYNKQQVNDDINRFKKLNMERLDDIKQKVEVARMEKERLIKEIESLKQDLNQDKQSEEFILYALKKIEDWMPLIDQIAHDEATEIDVETEEKEQVFNKKIAEFDFNIRNTQEDLDLLLNNALKKSESFSAEVMNFLHKKNIGNSNDQIQNISLPEADAEIQGIYDIIPQGDFCIDETKGYLDNREIVLVNKNLNFYGADEFSLENNDVSNDLSIVKSKYLVGKIAGEDLYDDNNDKIVGKNQIITDEVVRKALKRGKLADLIINMVSS